MEPINIFFIITTVFVGVLILLFLVITFYVWRMLRLGKDVAGTVKEFSQSCKAEGDEVITATKNLREKASHINIPNGVLTGFLLMAAKKFIEKKSKK